MDVDAYCFGEKTLEFLYNCFCSVSKESKGLYLTRGQVKRFWCVGKIML